MPLRRPVLSTLLAGAATAGLLLTATVPASAAPAAVRATQAVAATDDGVAVAGLGTVNGTPDRLRLQLRVVGVRPDAPGALAAANAAAGRVRTALRQHGVLAEDIQTTQLSVTPVNAGKPPRRVGFQVVQGITAQLRTLTGAGETITDVVRVGGAALRFDGVYLLISDDSPLQAQARERAFAAARVKAEQYARLTGRTLGPVLSIQEDLGSYAYEGGYGSFRSAGQLATAGGDYVVSPGTQRVDVRAVVRWALV